jgi:phospholipid transport system substrate-binding protein
MGADTVSAMRKIALQVAGIVAVVLIAPGVMADDGPRKTVERLNAASADVLAQAAQLGYAGRFQRLTPVMEQSFDFDFMAEKSLGRHWKELNDAQKTQWAAVFREFTIANYAANLDRDTGQRFEILGEEPDLHDTVLVRGRVLDPTAEPLDLTYRLQRAPKGWCIIDVQLRGTVSELALRRADFTSVVARDGFDALVTTVRGRIADLAAGRGKRPAT